jgi:hypothetical protein
VFCHADIPVISVFTEITGIIDFRQGAKVVDMG